uniref:Delta-like protein n=1 Tax=Macrostomum lignano TaxID=282301 RepID=A0A1I8G1R2_9PLAT
MAQCLWIVMVVRSLLFVYYFHCCWLLGSCQGLELQQNASQRAASSVDYCQSKPCQNGGLCSSGETTYTCYCQDTDYEGTNCNSWINDCQPNPCQNGGKCTDGLRSYTCDCSMTDFYGANCQNRIDDCMPNRCQNGAVCIDGFRNYTCNCYDGFSGPDCSVDYEDCTPHLCKNEGRCLEISNQKYYGLAGYPPPFNGTFNYSMAAGYICWCPSGAYGTHCEINPNDCLDPATNRSVCVHASSCTDGLASFTCHCLPGYEGSNCSREIDECRSLPPPCPSGATCIDRLADFECANCPAGLGGRKCSVSLTGCDSNWCQNGATCQPILLQEFPTPLHDYRCVCSLERSFTGRNCSVQLPDFAFGLDGNASSASFLSLNPADSNFTANNSWTIELRLVTLSRGAFLLLLGDPSDSATTPRLLATIDHSGRLSAQLLHGNGSHIAALTSLDSVATGSFVSVKISVSISGLSLSLSVSSSVRSASLSSASPLPQLSGRLIIGGFSGAKPAPAPSLVDSLASVSRSKRSAPSLPSGVASLLPDNITAFRGIVGSARLNGRTAATFGSSLISPSSSQIALSVSGLNETLTAVTGWARTRQSDCHLLTVLSGSHQLSVGCESGHFKVSLDDRTVLVAVSVATGLPFNFSISCAEGGFLTAGVSTNASDFRVLADTTPIPAGLILDSSATVTAGGPRFKGCLDNLRLNGYLVPLVNRSLPSGYSGFNWMAASSILPGCHGDAVCQKTSEGSSNVCLNGGQCVALWNDFKCDCPAGFLDKECSIKDASPADFPTAIVVAVSAALVVILIAIVCLKKKLNRRPTSQSAASDSESNGSQPVPHADANVELRPSTGYLVADQRDSSAGANAGRALPPTPTDEGIDLSEDQSLEQFDKDANTLVRTRRAACSEGDCKNGGFFNTGTNCEINIDDCASKPCANGLCSDLATDYNCSCFTGWEGRNCSINHNDCPTDACLNGGRCIDGNGTFTCACTDTGFTGDRCQNNIDDCASKPCTNGLCTDLVKNYSCSCFTGWEGRSCSVDTDYCLSGPCQNGGICSDGNSTFTCDCSATDFNGPNCQSRIDGCASNPCSHNATCTDGLRDFSCSCFSGYSGKTCSDDIPDCSPNPCQFGGACLERSNQALYGNPTMPAPFNGSFSYALAAGFVCLCKNGTNGDTCEINPNDCLDPTTNRSVCAHASSCTDGLASFTCHCLPGYEGLTCSREIDVSRTAATFSSSLISPSSSQIALSVTGLNETLTAVTGWGRTRQSDCHLLTVLSGSHQLSVGCESGHFKVSLDDRTVLVAVSIATGLPFNFSISCAEGTFLTAGVSINASDFRVLADTTPIPAGLILDSSATVTAGGPGFKGCLDNLRLNGYLVPLVNRSLPSGYSGFNWMAASSILPGCHGDAVCQKTSEGSSNVCLNGGQCVALWNDFKCDCPAGFLGKECSIKEASPADFPTAIVVAVSAALVVIFIGEEFL